MQHASSYVSTFDHLWFKRRREKV